MFGSSDYAGTKIDLMKHGQREMKKRIFLALLPALSSFFCMELWLANF